MLFFLNFLVSLCNIANILSPSDSNTDQTKKVSCISYLFNLLLCRTMTMKRKNCWQQEVGILERLRVHSWLSSGHKSPLSSELLSTLAVSSNSTNQILFSLKTNLFPKASVQNVCFTHQTYTVDVTQLVLEQDVKDVGKSSDSKSKFCSL